MKETVAELGVSGLPAPTEPRPGCDRTPTAPSRLNPGPIPKNTETRVVRPY